MTKEYLYLAIDGFTKFNWAVTSKTRFVQDKMKSFFLEELFRPSVKSLSSNGNYRHKI